MIEGLYLDQLQRFPHPWNQMEGLALHDQLAVLPDTAPNIDNALTVFEQCLDILVNLPPLEFTEMPEDWQQYWTFVSVELRESMPTIQDFDRTLIEKFVNKGSDQPNPALVEEICDFILSGFIGQDAEAPLEWFSKVRRHTTDQAFIARLQHIIERYFYQVDNYMATIMLLYFTPIAGKAALPFLYQIANNPATSKKLREEALMNISLIEHPN